MNKNIKDLLIEIKDLAKFNENYAMCTYKLGVIKGLCEEYLEIHTDIEEELVNNMLPVTSRIVPSDEPISPITFEEYCKNEMDKKDTWLKNILDRRGNHMNLNFEISSRWSNPSNKKMILRLLNQKKICTMNDLMTMFDDIDNFRALKYCNATNDKENAKRLNKIFPLFELSEADRKQMLSLYMTANDHPSGLSDEMYFRKFLTEDDNSSTYTTRYANAFLRNEITNVNQLYFFLTKHNLKDITKLRGVGHVSSNIVKMHSTIQEVM